MREHLHIYSVPPPNLLTISNVTDAPSIATHFARHRRLLEIMMILGVDRFTISSSHWIDFTIVFFITGLGVAGVSTAIFEGTSGGYLFLLILIFGFAIVSFCFLCASVFNRSKIGEFLLNGLGNAVQTVFRRLTEVAFAPRFRSSLCFSQEVS